MNPASVGRHGPTHGMTPGAVIEVLGRMQDELLEIKALLRGSPQASDEILLDRIAHRAHRISVSAEKRFLSIATKAREVAWMADEIIVGYGDSNMAHLNRRVIILEDHLRRAIHDATGKYRLQFEEHPTV